jgi:hypothetical protein
MIAELVQNRRTRELEELRRGVGLEIIDASAPMVPVRVAQLSGDRPICSSEGPEGKQQSLGFGAEKHVVNQTRVLQRQSGQLLRQREDDVRELAAVRPISRPATCHALLTDTSDNGFQES